VGGTLDPAAARITVSFSGAGWYALFGAPPGAPDFVADLPLFAGSVIDRIHHDMRRAVILAHASGMRQ
jgi:hypothetical protein